jgi:heterodisulfide reductase subunit C
MTPPTKQPALNVLPLKERMKVPRQHMLEQPPLLRATNFTEVNLGYSEELARQEALRCLECAKPQCTNDCPVGVKVKDFVQLIVAGDFMGADAIWISATCPRLHRRGKRLPSWAAVPRA